LTISVNYNTAIRNAVIALKHWARERLYVLGTLAVVAVAIVIVIVVSKVTGH